MPAAVLLPVLTLLAPPFNSPSAAYAKPLMLSAIDFTSDDSDAFIGWGFMPDSVKKLYPKGARGGMLGGDAKC